MEKVRVGLIGEAITSVTEAQTAQQMGSGSLNVFATPAMIALMEAACVSTIDSYLSPGKASVGIAIEVQHLSATPIGERINVMAEITQVEGRRVTLEVRAWDEHELIGEGKHTRYIIDVESFLSRLNSATTPKKE